MDYAPTGDLSDYDDTDIALAAGWDGDAVVFVSALIGCGPGKKPGFIESDENGRRIHDWDDFAGKLIRDRKRRADHMRESRAGNVPNTNEERDGHVTVTLPSRDPLPTNQHDQHDQHDQQTVAAFVARGTSASFSSKTEKEISRRMWDAFVIAGLIAPKTESERGKWNRGIAQISRAGKTEEDVPNLVRRYKKRFGADIPCNPLAIAGNLSELEAEPVVRPSSNGHGRAVDRSELAKGDNYAAMVEERMAREAAERRG